MTGNTMNELQEQMLQETHDSTIRQEVILKGVEDRFVRGDVRFKEHDAQIKAVEGRLGILEEKVKPIVAERKRLRWASRLALVAMSYPAGVWLWEHLVKAAAKLKGP